MVNIVLQKLLQMEFRLLFIWLKILASFSSHPRCEDPICFSKELALYQNIEFFLIFFVCDLMLHFALQYLNVDVLIL